MSGAADDARHNGSMRFFPRPSSEAVADHRTATGERGRVLATASGPRVELLAFVDHFAYRYADGDWQCVGWHEVYSGGWRAEADEMHWRTVDGRRESFQLSEPGTFGQVFRERVQATIALEQTFDAPGHGSISISARRSLARGASGLVWHVRAVGGASMDDPATLAEAQRLEALLRADYDF